MTVIISGDNGVSDVDGSAGTPAIRGTDANTGIFFGSDIIGFSEGGTECARFNADAQFVAAAGTASLPVITTTGDVNTGIFFPAADTIAFAEGGAEAMRLNSSGQILAGTTTAPSSSQVRQVLVGSGGSYTQYSDAGGAGFVVGAVGSSRLGFYSYTGNVGSETYTERAGVTSGGDFQFNSGYGSSATAYGCRAWVNYDGTGTPAIREDGNVSSLSDLGTGQWLVNFTANMPDANYCCVATCNEVDNATICQARLPATSNVAIDIYTSPSGLSNSRADPSRINVAIFR